MKRNRTLALALTLGAALLTLSGCDGMQGGTIDYIDGHWVFTSAQTEQQTDITKLLANPDAFYTAACAMGDEELQGCFDMLTSGQCAALFRSLGEERAMTLAGRLTPAQVERLLSALNGQDRIPTDPAALAAVWQTLTTDEQLMALGGLSAEDYAALCALLGGAAPSPEPEAVLPAATDAPDMTDPAVLAGIWHTLTQQEQSDVLSGLSSAQFVALWSLLDERSGAADTPAVTDTPAAAEDTVQIVLRPDAEEGMAEAEQTQPPQESEQIQETEAGRSAAQEAAQHAGMTDPEALADAWHTLSPQEQMSAIAVLTTDQFVYLQELLSGLPRPTPVEEDELFIPTPEPTARRTPMPTAAPVAQPGESESGDAAPDFSDPAVLAGIWHTLSAQEQLSILSSLTLEQYVALQELLAQLPNSGDGAPEDAAQAGEQAPAQSPNVPDAATGDEPMQANEATPAEAVEPGEAAGGAAAPEEETPSENPDEPGEATIPADPTDETQAELDFSDPAVLAGIWHTLTPQEQLSILSALTREQVDALQALLQMDSGESMLEGANRDAEKAPVEKADASDKAAADVTTPEDEAPAEGSDASGETAAGLSLQEDGAAQLPDMPGRLLPGLIVWPDGEATPSEALPVSGQAALSQARQAELSMMLKNAKP